MKKNLFFSQITALALLSALVLAACPDSSGPGSEEPDPYTPGELGAISIKTEAAGAYIGSVISVDISGLLGGSSLPDYEFYVSTGIDPDTNEPVFDVNYPLARPSGTYEVRRDDHGKYIKARAWRDAWDWEDFVDSEPVGPVIRGYVVKTISTKDHGGEPYIGLRGLSVDSNGMLYTVGRRGQAGSAYLWRIDPKNIDPATGEAKVTDITGPSLSGSPRFVAIGADDQAYVPRMWYYFEVERFNTVTGTMTRISENILAKMRDQYTEPGGIGSAGPNGTEANGGNPGTRYPFNENGGLNDIAVDSRGVVYVNTPAANGNTILKITPAPFGTDQPSWASAATLFAGGLQADAAAGTVFGTGSEARFRSLDGITAGPDGYIYATDGYGAYVVRIHSETGIVEPFIGSGGWGNLDGVGAGARVHQMRAITYGKDGYLYFVDRAGSGDYSPVVRRIHPQTREVATIAGHPNGGVSFKGVVDGLARDDARFMNLWGIAADADGSIYVMDEAGDNNPSKIRMIYFDNN